MKNIYYYTVSIFCLFALHAQEDIDIDESYYPREEQSTQETSRFRPADLFRARNESRRMGFRIPPQTLEEPAGASSSQPEQAAELEKSYEQIFGELPSTAPEEIEFEPISLERSIMHPVSQHIKTGAWEYATKPQLIAEFGQAAENKHLHTARQSAAVTQFDAPVRTRFRYTPVGKLRSTKKILVLFIHGTFAHDREKFKSDQLQAFKEVLDYAQLVAHSRMQTCDVVSWSWNAYNSHIEREHAGKQLAELIDKQHHNYDHVITIGHSHGCNVINIASHHLKKTYIDTAIYFACPVRGDNKDYIPTDRIKTIYNFYSSADKIQWVGAIDDTSYYTMFGSFIAGSPRLLDSNRADINIINIDTKADGITMGHSSILGALGALYNIIKTIEGHYPGCHNLVAHTQSANGKIIDILVALAPSETLGNITNQALKANMREYSDSVLEEFRKQYKRDMYSVTWKDWLTALK